MADIVEYAIEETGGACYFRKRFEKTVYFINVLMYKYSNYSNNKPIRMYIESVIWNTIPKKNTTRSGGVLFCERATKSSISKGKNDQK